MSDAAHAQRWLDRQPRTAWPKVLNRLLSQAHPLHAELGRPVGQTYYWSAAQPE